MWFVKVFLVFSLVRHRTPDVRPVAPSPLRGRQVLVFALRRRRHPDPVRTGHRDSAELGRAAVRHIRAVRSVL